MGISGVVSSATFIALLAASGPAAPGAFDGIPNVSIQSYDVGGRSVSAIRRAINAVRPTDTNDGKRVDGLNNWNMNWRWHRDAGGRCRTTIDDITFNAVVKVPRLADPGVPARIRAQFDRYLATLLAHEESHVRYAWEHRGDVADAMNAAGCADMNEAAQAALRKIVAHDVAFDKATNHGATTIVPFG